MPFSILVPNTYAFRPKRTASLYLVYPGISAFLYFSISLFILLLMRGSVTSFSWIETGWYLLLTSIEINLLLLTLLLTVLIRLVLTVFQVLSMLLLDSLFSLKSNFDVNISLRISFSFFRSSIWFCNDLIFFNYVP